MIIWVVCCTYWLRFVPKMSCDHCTLILGSLCICSSGFQSMGIDVSIRMRASLTFRERVLFIGTPSVTLALGAFTATTVL